MKPWQLPIALLAAAVLVTARRELNQEGHLWAVLVAGSAGYGNYRHQADVAHAYQVLRRGGIKDDRIIVLMYDDVAHSESNPHPGQLFNAPGGPDVYAGITIDYSHASVTAETFLAVLAGNASGVPPPSRHSSGRVLQAGPQDKVFVYYSDHGAPGILGMPSGPFLYADQLHAVLTRRSKQNGFKEMVIYIEACESGSIFEGLLEDKLGIYATTAANGRESSWGTYCPGMYPAPPSEFGTCLGDLYSVAWMENADEADLTLETLKKQFQLVKQRVSQNYTYSMGSHVMRFGTLGISEEVAAEFMGYGNTGARQQATANGAVRSWAPQGAVPQRDADLAHLWHKFASSPEGPAKAAALSQLSAETSSRSRVDAEVRASVQRLLDHTNALALLRTKFGAQLPLLAAQPAADNGAVAELVVGQELPRPEGTPLVDDWDCLRGMVAAWEASCGPLDQYGMRHTRAFANLCNLGVAPAALAANSCGGPAVGAGSKLVGPDAHIAAA